MSALPYSLLGVDRQTIGADFRLSEQFGLPGDREALETLLDHLAESGGIEAYPARMGVSADL
jgi:hypothetical protein